MIRLRPNLPLGASRVGFPPQLLNIDAALFSRGSEGAIDSASSLVWAPNDTLRTRLNRYLIEGRRTNDLTAALARDLTNPGWGAPTGVVTPNQAAGPDGTAAIADLVDLDSGEYGPFSVKSAGLACASFWARRESTPGVVQSFFGTTGQNAFVNESIDATWRKIRLEHNVSAASNGLITLDGRATTAGMANQAVRVLADLFSVELGWRYVTSTIRADVREADDLQWIAPEVPQVLRSGSSRWRLWLWYPHTLMASGDIRVLGSFGGANDTLRLRHDGTGVKCEVVTSGVVRIASANLQWTREVEWNVTVNMLAGTLAIAGTGITSGAGTTSGTAAISWAASLFRLGGTWGGQNELDGGISIPEAV